MKIKEYEPLYKEIEPIYAFDEAEFDQSAIAIEIMSIDALKKHFGDYYIYSVCNYHDTHTTSIIFGKSDLEPGEEVQFLENDGTGVRDIK